MSEVRDSDGYWKPTDQLLRGVIVKPFLPLVRHPELINHSNAYNNLFAGSEVYIFEETVDGKWCRAYFCLKPLPESFLATMTAFGEQLPGMKTEIVIFPKKFVHINPNSNFKTTSFLTSPDQDNINTLVNNKCNTPALYDTINVNKESVVQVLTYRKPPRPPFPYGRYNDRPLQDEIGAILFLLASHIFSTYAAGEFSVHKKLINLYRESDSIRVILEFNLYTEAEYIDLIRSGSCLLAKIAKYIFATTRSKKLLSSTKDPSGFQGIFARNTNSGELLSYDAVDLQTLVISSVFYGLTSNFPVSGYEKLRSIVKPPNLESFAHYHFVIDFKDIKADPAISNPNLENIVTSVYLRTKTEILTEPYIVYLTPGRDISLSLRHASAVLFKDIPETIIRSNRIYLVVVLTEKVSVQVKGTATSDLYKSPFIPYKHTTKGAIKSIKRGISVGVIDLSPVFMNPDRSSNIHPHRFIIHFYAPNYDVASEFDTTVDENPGWGGVVTKIFNDATDGIIINPRTLSMAVTIKDISNDKTLEESFTPIDLPVRTVNANFFNDMYNPKEVIYLNLGKVNLIGIEKKVTNIKNITIKITTSNSNITMNEYSNEKKSNEMEFISMQPGELIGGRIAINNVDLMRESEHLNVYAYLNGLLMAKGIIPLKSNDLIIEYKGYTSIELLSSEDKKLVNLNITTEYPGNRYNIEKNIREFHRIVEGYTSDKEIFEEEILNTLRGLNTLEVTTLLRTIDRLLYTYLNLIYMLTSEGNTVNSDKFVEDVFEYFILFLKKILNSKEKNCRQKLFKMYYKYCTGEPSKLPVVGLALLKCLKEAYHANRNGSNEYDLALCEISVFVLLLSVISTKSQKEEWKREYLDTFEEYCIYLSSSFKHILVGQFAMLQTYDIWLSILELYFEPKDLFSIATMVLMSFEYELEGLSTTGRKMTENENKFLNTKYLLLQRVLLYDAFKEYLHEFGSDDPMILIFFTKCINSTLLPYQLFQNRSSQVDTIRLANSVMITLIRSISSQKILKNLIKLIPTYCKNFIHLRKYAKKSGLFKPRRTFTGLFPLEFPFPKYYVDSIVNDEVIVEVLLEISTLICQLSKIALKLYGSNLSFKSIVFECKDDINFQSDFYLKEMTLAEVKLIISTVRTFFKGDLFPEKKWLGITALLARSSLILLYMCQDTLDDYNTRKTPDDTKEIDIKLWADFFKNVLMIGNHKIAKLSKLAPISRKAVYRISGRLRTTAAEILDHSWNSLANGTFNAELSEKYGVGNISGYQLLLFKESPSLVSKLFIFSLHQDIDATKVCCKIFWASAIFVWRKYNSFQKCLDYVIPDLYNGFQAGRIYIYENELNYFVQCILLLIHVPVDDPIFESLIAFLNEIIGFLHILMEAYKIPIQKEYDADRVTSQIEMFSYLLDANKPELFHRMLYDIYCNSIKKKDFVQAALSLELLASTYAWDTNEILDSIPYPPLQSQSSFERKEHLYKEAARNFSKGLKMERALSVYKDLIKAYDEINYDLNGLAYAYEQISTIYTDLQSIDRLVPTYFKVAFMGFGFSSSLRNKIFIFEGLPFEHITSMQNRLINVYHGSTIIQSQVDELLLKPTMGKYINVTTVEPRFHLSDDYTKRVKKSDMNNKIRMYIENRDLRTFSSSRRLPGSTSVLDLWVEESTYTAASTFPTLMYRSEIIDVQVSRLSPIENAIRSLQMKIQELNGLLNMGHKVLKENGDSSEIFDELSRNITGTISAPINGGSLQYKEFLKEPNSNDLAPADIIKLSTAFDELVVLLNACLALHQELLPSKTLKNGHYILMKLFEENFTEEITRNHVIVGTTTGNITAQSIPTSTSRRNSVKSQGKLTDFSMRGRSTTLGTTNQSGSIYSSELTTSDSNPSNKYVNQLNPLSSSNMNINLILTPTVSNESDRSDSIL